MFRRHTAQSATQHESIRDRHHVHDRRRHSSTRDARSSECGDHVARQLSWSAFGLLICVKTLLIMNIEFAGRLSFNLRPNFIWSLLCKQRVATIVVSMVVDITFFDHKPNNGDTAMASDARLHRHLRSLFDSLSYCRFVGHIQRRVTRRSHHSRLSCRANRLSTSWSRCSSSLFHVWWAMWVDNVNNNHI